MKEQQPAEVAIRAVCLALPSEVNSTPWSKHGSTHSQPSSWGMEERMWLTGWLSQFLSFHLVGLDAFMFVAP
jgi:hypothetical protein